MTARAREERASDRQKGLRGAYAGSMPVEIRTGTNLKCDQEIEILGQEPLSEKS